MMERYIAIDNVCAWPNLTRMPDGEIIATIFNQPTHGGWEGDVECWGSKDEGKFWHKLGTAAPHEPTTNRMNVAAGAARDGSLVVLASGWSKRNKVGDYSSPHEGEVLPTWVCRSEDGGRTWTHESTVDASGDGPETIVPFGDIVQLADGNLGVSCYSWKPPGDIGSHFYVSEDDGRTWSWRGIIRRGDSNETAPVVLPDGTLLAAVRTAKDAHLELCESNDNGATWSDKGPITLGGQIPGHLLVLQDSRLLLTFGIRNTGQRGIGVRLSGDNGASWSAPRRIVDLEGGGDMGYPASVQSEDGTVITAYYCKHLPQHLRYHMGVARWSLPE